MGRGRVAVDSDTQNWTFSQCFGDKSDIDSITESDVISAAEFDHSGDYLATGDRGGRVVLFERQDGGKMANSEYRFLTEFQSHDREFDYLKSLEIEEKINQIKWLRRQNNALFLLSTNDKTIKLWKVFQKNLRVVAENNSTDILPPETFIDIKQLHLPRMNLHDTIIATTPRRIYANAHTYHINSISPNSDNETFLSSDDLRINLWNLEVANQSFNIVDTRPASMEELTEVITATECHPTSCNLFMYSTCKGNVRLADMRERALCDNYAKVFEDTWDPLQDSFFTEITSSISDIKFSPDGRYIIARDFMTVKIWDINMDHQPVKTIRVHENIRNMLCATYESDSIFDKFEVVCSGDSKSIMTGSYSNNFQIYNNALLPDHEETVVSLQADKNVFRSKRSGSPKSKGRSRVNMMRRPRKQVDFRKNILHLSWHPYENTVAIAATNNLFVFNAPS